MFYKPITILCLLCCLLLNLQAYATKDLVATSATESQRAMDHQRGIDFLQNEDDHSTYSQNFGNAVARYYGYALSSYGSGYGSAKINNPSSINQNYYASNNKEFSRLDKQKGANRQLLDEEVHKIYELSKIYSEKKNMPLEKGTAIVSKAFYGLVDKDANDMYETNLNTQDALEYLEAQDFLKSKIDYSSTTTTYDGELSGLGWALKEQYNDRYSNLKGYSRNKKFYEKYLKIDNQADTSSGSGSAGGIKNFADGFKKPYKDLANEATNNTLEFLKATAIGILLTPKTGFDFGENLHKTHEKANLDDLLGDRQSRDQKRGEIAGNIAPIAAGGTIGGILKKGKNAHKVGEAGRAAEGAGTTKLPATVGETTGTGSIKTPAAISGKVDLQQGQTFAKPAPSTEHVKRIFVDSKSANSDLATLVNNTKSDYIVSKKGLAIVKSNIGNKATNLTINVQKQNKHIMGTKEYLDGRSILTITVDEAQRLINDYSGTGRIYGKNKEVIKFNKIIGKYYDGETNTYLNTKNGTVHYSKSGTHIVPARP